ncbi:hypothetical protein MYX76_06270 [Desulfobacterota bacterium AH_259_B03_O07]|nr:hypothetical protein [Desulfobacterota bacterium AH_259_B03_O07]
MSSRFKLTEQSLEKLKEQKVPDEILNKLRTLLGQSSIDEEKFVEILKLTIGDGDTELYKSLILSNSQTNGFWEFIKKWGGPVAVAIILLILIWILWEFSGKKLDLSKQSPEEHQITIPGRIIFVLIGMIIPVFVVWFLFLFTGRITPQRMYQMVLFCYLFTIISLLGSVLPFIIFPSIPILPQLMIKSPIGILNGCIEDKQPNNEGQVKQVETANQRLPQELICSKSNGQWVVNIGGTISSEDKQKVFESFENKDQKLRDLWPLLRIQGGLVVPLYFIVLSLMGAAVSMTRRVPEYQGRIRNGEDDEITEWKAREMLVFQIMQVVSAPLIAVTAYYLIDPSSRTTTVILGFSSGFASETILLLIRSLVNKIRPESISLPKPKKNKDALVNQMKGKEKTKAELSEVGEKLSAELEELKKQIPEPGDKIKAKEAELEKNKREFDEIQKEIENLTNQLLET